MNRSKTDEFIYTRKFSSDDKESTMKKGYFSLLLRGLRDLHSLKFYFSRTIQRMSIHIVK